MATLIVEGEIRGVDLHVGDEYVASMTYNAAGDIYDWTQRTDTLPMYAALRWTYMDRIFIVYMDGAYPVQIAGPRLKELHVYVDPFARPGLPRDLHDKVDAEYQTGGVHCGVRD